MLSLFGVFLWQLTALDTPVETLSANIDVSPSVPPGGVGVSLPRVDAFSAESGGGGKDGVAAPNSSTEAKKAKKSKFGLKMPSTLKRGKFSEVSSALCCW